MSDDKKQLAKISLEQRVVVASEPVPYRSTPEELSRLGERCGVAAVDLSRVRVPVALLERIPRETAQAHRLLVLEETAGAVRVAMEDPLDQKALDEVSFVLGKEVEPRVAPAIDLAAALESAYLAVRRGERYFTGPGFEGDTSSSGSAELEFVPLARSRPPEAEPQPSAPAASPVASPAASTASAAAAKGARLPQSGPELRIAHSDAREGDAIEAWLAARGYRTTRSLAGEEVIAALKERPPSLLLLDTALAGVSGLDLAQRLRASRRFASLPLVVLVAPRHGWPVVEDLLARGIRHCLARPFAEAALLGVVKRALGEVEAAGEPPVGEQLQAALRALQRGEVEVARRELEAAAASNPGAHEPHLHLGLLEGKAGRVHEAIACFERALELEPRDFACVKSLAILYQQAGFANAALDLWQRALHLAPDDTARAGIQERVRALLGF